MEHETFSDEAAAERLNQVCVCVKVDREERPDVDALYMESCVMLTGGGGWPLSVFMMPDKRPFFAGTYYPPDAFVRILARIEGLWKTERKRLTDASDGLMDALRESPAGAREKEFSAEEAEAMAREAYLSLAESYDAQYGGFGRAPKFPSVHTLMFLERYGQLHPNTPARAMGRYTLERMAMGGLFDHVGGGFFRYSVDRFYKIPHFEKMLYDNAQMAVVYAEAGLYETAGRVLDFCFREMRSPEGAFYTALDADSEGREGAYYLLRREDLRVLGEDAQRYAEWFDITDTGNYEGENLPNLLSFGPLGEREKEMAKRGHASLLAKRNERVRPMRDEKVLLSSNGLMLGSLATCGRLMRRAELVDAAVMLAAFLRDNLRRDGRYYAVYYEGKLGPHKATSDDYAYFAWGLYRLHQATLDEQWLTLCGEVCEEMLRLFLDRDGLLFLSGGDVTDLPLNTKNLQDGALPSGNAMAAGVMRRLFILTGEVRWKTASERMFSAMLRQARRYPPAYTAALSAALLAGHGRKLELPAAGSAERRNLCDVTEGFYPFACVRQGRGERAQVCTEKACLPSTGDPEVLKCMLHPPFQKS